MITVFSLVDAVILRPLPVRAPHELVWMRDPSFSFPVFKEVQARGTMLSSVFAWTAQTLSVQLTNEPEPTPILMASGRIHETLGLRPAMGRLLTESDVGQSASEAQTVAVLSHAAWQRRFGGDPTAIGRTIRIEGTPFTIIGVTPPEFFGVAVGIPVDVTIPVTMLLRLRDDERGALTRVGMSWLNIMGRLRPGLSVTAADAAFQTIWPQILTATADGVDAAFRPRYLTFTSGLEPGAYGDSRVRRQFREPLCCCSVSSRCCWSRRARQLPISCSRPPPDAGTSWPCASPSAPPAALGLLFSFWAAHGLVRLLSTSYDIVIVDLAPSTGDRVRRDGRRGRDGGLHAGADRARLAHRSWTDARIEWAADRRRPADPSCRDAGRRPGCDLADAARGIGAFRAEPAKAAREGHRLRSGEPARVSVDALSPVSARSRARADAPDWIPYYAELLQRLRDTAGVRSARLSYKPPISNEQGYWFGHVAADGAPAPPWRERTYLNAISPGYVALSVPPSLPGVISRRAIAMAAHVSRSSMLRWRGRSSATSRRSGVIS